MAKQDAKDFFGPILDSIADGVFTVDRENRVTSFNRAAERITGFSRAEAAGQYCFDIFRASICQSDCALRHTLETGEQVINRAANIIAKDGRQVPISISTALLRDESGEVIGGVETFRDLSAIEELRKALAQQYSFEDIVSKNHRMQEIFRVLPDVAESDCTVLIQGPSGSGKELLARAIHSLSRRRGGPYVAVNCGALPETLLESELFGYVKGAFTGAARDKPGRFALAEGGVLLLDEVGDLAPSLQVKLLRVLEEKAYEPLGATAPVSADVRVIAATHRDLARAVEEGAFRQDFYFRLNVVKLVLPPLADRREDIPLLVDHFVQKLGLRTGKAITGVSDEVMELLMQHSFPGNVRELENIIEHTFVLCRGGLIRLEHLPAELRHRQPEPTGRTPDLAAETVSAPLAPLDAVQPLSQLERQAIIAALRKHKGRKSLAAKELGINRTTLWRKMKRHGIS
jgi:PAS domain S-box-containing protein